MTTIAFELGADELAAIAPTGGRVAKPSIYLEDVKAAIGADKAFGILIPKDTKGTKIVSELHKAAASLGVKVKVWNRETAPKPFVGFKVKTQDPAEVPATDAKATATK